MNTAEAFLELVAACNIRDLNRALRLFSADTVYHNMPTQPLRGVDGVRSVLKPFLEGSEEIEWIVHCMAQPSPSTLLAERTDRFKMNGRWLSLPVMGFFEVHSGIITHWRDYYDAASIMTQIREASQPVVPPVDS